MKSTPFNVFAKDFAKYLLENDLTTNRLVDKEFVCVGAYKIREANKIFKNTAV